MSQRPAEEDGTSMLVFNCLLKCRDIILGIVDLSDPELLNSYDRWFAKVREDKLDWVEAAEALDLKLTANLIAMPVMGYIIKWYDEECAQYLSNTDLVLEYFVEPDGSLADRTVRLVVSAMVELANLHLGRAEETTAAGDRFSELAKCLLDDARYPEAMAAADAARYLFGTDAAGAAFLHACELALTAAKESGDEEDIRVRQACVAAALAAAARSPEEKLKAFDAVEAACRQLPDGEGRESTLNLLVKVTGADGANHKLRMYLAMAAGHAAPPPLRTDELKAIVKLTGDMDPDEWGSLLNRLLPDLAAIENSRFALQPRKAADRVVADWETFSFTHPSFSDAVPLADSILKERDLHDLLFVVHHETTHVYSMRSGVGQDIAALRVAVLELELRLWSFIDGVDAQSISDNLLKHGTAPLDQHEILALAQAEQSLALTQKLQIVQDIWQPWFEGIAVFAELADDPTMDADARTDAMTALLNLFDPEDVAEDDAYLGMLAMAEKRYSEALRTSARHKLRTYLVDHHDHYLPGYFAVRSIVASWRRRAAKALSGSTATRILLYFTRYGTWDVVPDLALPIEEFRREAAGNLRRWLASIGRTDATQLASILGAFPGSASPVLLRWQDGRIEPAEGTIEELSAEGLGRGLARVRQALRSLTADYADPGRVRRCIPPRSIHYGCRGVRAREGPVRRRQLKDDPARLLAFPERPRPVEDQLSVLAEQSGPTLGRACPRPNAGRRRPGPQTTAQSPDLHPG